MSGSVIGSIAATAFALVLVLGLAYAVIRALRLWQDRSLSARDGTDSGTLKFLRAMPIGPRERVILMEAEDERLLLGVTAGQITLLRCWPRRIPAASDSAGTPRSGSETVAEPAP